MLNVQIQELAPHQFQRFKTLRLAALANAPDAYGSTLEAAQTRRDDEWREQVATLPTFVAVVEQRDCGLVRYSIDNEDVYLLSMWVSEFARGAGVGEALINTVLEHGRRMGRQRVLLDVGDHNVHAINLYRRAGFTPTGVTGHLPAPREHVSEHQMAVDLGR